MMSSLKRQTIVAVALSVGLLYGCGTSSGGGGGAGGLSAPSGLTATDAPDDRGTSLTLKWIPSNSGNVMEHRVYRSTTSGGPYSLVVGLASRRANSFTDNGLTKGTLYYYMVRASDGVSESPDSNEASATPIDNLTVASVEITPATLMVPVDSGGQQFTAVAKDAGGGIISAFNFSWAWRIVNDDGTKGIVDRQTGIYFPPPRLPDSNVVVLEARITTDPTKSGSAAISLLTGSLISFGNNMYISRHAAGDDFDGLGRRSMAVLGSSVYVVWADQSGGSYDIHLARSRDRGQTVDCQVTLVRSGDQRAPSLVLDSQGNGYLTWYDNRLFGVLNIYFAKVGLAEENCSTLGQAINAITEISVTSDAQGSHQRPSLAVDPQDNVFIAWQYQDAQKSSIHLAKGTLNESGAIIFSLHELTSSNSFTHIEPDIALDRNGNAYIIWVDNRRGPFSVNFARCSNSLSCSGEVQVSPNNAIIPFSPTVAVDPSGIVYATWNDQTGTNDQDVFLAKSLNGGQTFPTLTNVTSSIEGVQYSPMISLDPAGKLYLAWENDRAGNKDIYFAKSVNGGQTFRLSPQSPVNDDNGTSGQYAPRLSLDSAGRAFLLWFDERNTCSSFSCPYAIYFAMGQ